VNGVPPILLLQIRGREHEAAMLQERLCFCELGGFERQRMHSINVVETPQLAWEDVELFEVMLVGGAGTHSVTRDYDFTRPLAEIVRRWVGEERPFLGSCWGHQFLARILGGEVVTDVERGEVGTLDVELTAAGRRDPLFGGMRRRFAAHFGHHDLVTELPAGMVELARTELCPNQAVRLDGLPIYGTQFHCEISTRRMHERLLMYRDEYLDGAERSDEEVLASLGGLLRPTPQAERLVASFLSLYAPSVLGSQREQTPTPRYHLPADPAFADPSSDSMSDPGQQGQDSSGFYTSDPSTDDLELAAIQESGLTQTYDTAERAGLLEDPNDAELLDADVILIAHPENRRLGTRFRLSPGGRMDLGRSMSVEIPLPEVLSISRQHARLEYRGRQVTIRDLGSTNGTYVNGELTEGATVLHSGDRFQVAGVHFKFLHERDPEHAYYETIYDLVTRDGLTEIYNKRKYEEEVQREFARARRHKRPLSLVMFDIDDFKQINDSYGHLCGDFILKQVSSLAREMLRPEQVFARVGGDEFVILTPETDVQGGVELAKKLCNRVSSLDYTYCDFVVRVTCSFGVAALDKSMKEPTDLYHAADQAMMTSKRTGRNRVTVHGLEGEEAVG